MFVNVNINLSEGESPPAKDAKEILTLLGGDPATDTISVSVSSTSTPPPPVLPDPPA